MQLAIIKVILWPRDVSKKRRDILLKPGQLNIITGKSQTGKSAITPIIDYVLGSGKCTIPVGKIRDLTEWYGLLLQTSSSQMLIARRDPDAQAETTDMYLHEAESIAIPDRPAKNSARDTVLSRLNQLAGLPKLDFAPDAENPGFHSRPSFRDMAAFNFQPQYVVANPYTLFFKADTLEHREKLKAIFPLVLGAITGRTLALKRELSELRKELNQYTIELRSAEAGNAKWLAEVQSFYAAAKEVGLLPTAPDADDSWSIESYLRHLRTIPDAVQGGALPTMDVGNTDRAVEELLAIRNQEEYLAHELGVRRSRLARLREAGSLMGAYGTDLDRQALRLDAIGWFERVVSQEAMCPFCGTSQDSAKREVQDLMAVAAEFRDLSASVQDAPSALDKEIADLTAEIREFEGSLRQLRTRRAALDDRSAAVAARRQTIAQAYRLVGRLEQAMDNLDAVHTDSDTQKSIDQLRERIREIERIIDPKAERQRLDAALSKVTSAISHYAAILGYERSADRVELQTDELTVRVSSTRAGSRKDFLWEIGSGANWVGLHLATLLALHELFDGIKGSPVPQFLVVDQPSQIYFPERWPGDPNPKTKKAGDVSQAVSEDIEGVRRIFRALSEGIKRTDGRLQVLVTDHAGSITWQGVERVNVVAEWRGDNDYLIPREWESS